jgi:hypothetical protein
MQQERFHFLEGFIYGEGWEPIKATLCVDQRTAKLYVVPEQSYDRHEFDGSLVECNTEPGCFEFVEVIDHEEGPPSWWWKPCEMPEELAPVATKYSKPAKYRSVDDE